MNRTFRNFGLLLAAGLALLLAGCVTPGYGGYGYPGGYGQGVPYPSGYGSQVQGTVETVDANYGRLTLLADDPRSGYGQRLSVRFDRNTRLYYQGREYPVTGLERGDVIRFEAVQSGGELLAQGREQRIQRVEAATAHQRHRAVEASRPCGDRIHQALRNVDVAGRRREIQQATVDV